MVHLPSSSVIISLPGSTPSTSSPWDIAGAAGEFGNSECVCWNTRKTQPRAGFRHNCSMCFQLLDNLHCLQTALMKTSPMQGWMQDPSESCGRTLSVRAVSHLSGLHAAEIQAWLLTAQESIS